VETVAYACVCYDNLFNKIIPHVSSAQRR
jgi:hypothetical protein